MRTFSICLSDIPKDKIINHKNGKKYLNCVIWDNDQPDRYGNDFSVQIGKTKEEREAKAKAIYIGNGKIHGKDPAQKTDGGGEDLPF